MSKGSRSITDRIGKGWEGPIERDRRPELERGLLSSGDRILSGRSEQFTLSAGLDKFTLSAGIEGHFKAPEILSVARSFKTAGLFTRASELAFSTLKHFLQAVVLVFNPHLAGSISFADPPEGDERRLPCLQPVAQFLDDVHSGRRESNEINTHWIREVNAVATVQYAFKMIDIVKQGMPPAVAQELSAATDVVVPFSGITLGTPFGYFPNARRYYFIQTMDFGDVLKGAEALQRANYLFGDGPNARGVGTLLYNNGAGFGFSTVLMEAAHHTAGEALSPYLILQLQHLFGARIVKVEYVQIDSPADVKYIPLGEETGERLPHGRITFERNGQLQELYFLQADLSDQGQFDDIRGILPERDFAAMYEAIGTFNVIADFPAVTSYLDGAKVVLGDVTANPAGRPVSFEHLKKVHEDKGAMFGYGWLEIYLNAESAPLGETADNSPLPSGERVRVRGAHIEAVRSSLAELAEKGLSALGLDPGVVSRQEVIERFNPREKLLHAVARLREAQRIYHEELVPLARRLIVKRTFEEIKTNIQAFGSVITRLYQTFEKPITRDYWGDGRTPILRIESSAANTVQSFGNIWETLTEKVKIGREPSHDLLEFFFDLVTGVREPRVDLEVDGRQIGHYVKFGLYEIAGMFIKLIKSVSEDVSWDGKNVVFRAKKDTELKDTDEKWTLSAELANDENFKFYFDLLGWKFSVREEGDDVYLSVDFGEDLYDSSPSPLGGRVKIAPSEIAPSQVVFNVAWKRYSDIARQIDALEEANDRGEGLDTNTWYELRAQKDRAGTELVAQLPLMIEGKLKRKGHIYRGTLLRRMNVKDIKPDGSVQVVDMFSEYHERGLNVPVFFATEGDAETALRSAIDGHLHDDEKGVDRYDAVIVEVSLTPEISAAGKIDIISGSFMLPPRVLRGVEGIKIYRVRSKAERGPTTSDNGELSFLGGGAVERMIKGAWNALLRFLKEDGGYVVPQRWSWEKIGERMKAGIAILGGGPAGASTAINYDHRNNK